MMEYYAPPLTGILTERIEFAEHMGDGFYDPIIDFKQGSEVEILGKFQSDSYASGYAFLILQDSEVLSVCTSMVSTDYDLRLPLPTKIIPADF